MIGADLFMLLMAKHFVADFVLQPPFMYENKGKWLHPGGLVHAGLHGLAALALVPWPLAILDAVSHYLIDFTKSNVTRWSGWRPTDGSTVSVFGYGVRRGDLFFLLVGLDQISHTAIYYAMVGLAG